MKIKDDSDIQGIAPVSFSIHFDQDKKTYEAFKTFIAVATTNSDEGSTIKAGCKTFWCVWFFFLLFCEF